MQLPTQGPSLRRHRRLHPALGRFALQNGVAPSQDYGVDDMDDDDGADDADEGD